MNEDENQIADDGGSDLEYLKSDTPWLASFQLTDTEFLEVIRLMTRVIIGSDKIAGFYERLAAALKKDPATTSDIVVAILTHRFLVLKPYIDGFDEFVKSLGLEGLALQVEVKNQTKELESDKTVELKEKIAQYDWQQMSPLEKRVALEEIGMTQKKLDEFFKKNQ